MRAITPPLSCGGLPVPHDDHTHITVRQHGERLRRQGVKSHLGQAAARRTLRTGIPLSTPEQTFIDLAAIGVNLVDLVVLGDAMLKAELTTIPTLIGAIEAWQGYGTRLAVRAARLIGKVSTRPWRRECVCSSSWLDCLTHRERDHPR
jgi:hypothetical protein